MASQARRVTRSHSRIYESGESGGAAKEGRDPSKIYRDLRALRTREDDDVAVAAEEMGTNRPSSRCPRLQLATPRVGNGYEICPSYRRTRHGLGSYLLFWLSPFPFYQSFV